MDDQAVFIYKYGCQRLRSGLRADSPTPTERRGDAQKINIRIYLLFTSRQTDMVRRMAKEIDDTILPTPKNRSSFLM